MCACCALCKEDQSRGTKGGVVPGLLICPVSLSDHKHAGKHLTSLTSPWLPPGWSGVIITTPHPITAAAYLLNTKTGYIREFTINAPEHESSYLDNMFQKFLSAPLGNMGLIKCARIF